MGHFPPIIGLNKRPTHDRLVTMSYPALNLLLPQWVELHCAACPPAMPGVEARMRFVIGLARENVVRGTGGPFGAAVFEVETGRLVAPGVNMVVPAGCSIWHAEIVAIALTQRVLGTHDLGAEGVPACELVTSTEPCAMCLGAIPWSGLGRLVCGAREADATAIGMDEGAKPADWAGELARRGIDVVRDVCRDEAAAVLRTYAADGGVIYNGTRSGPAVETPGAP